jgi:hypothetical protein
VEIPEATPTAAVYIGGRLGFQGLQAILGVRVRVGTRGVIRRRGRRGEVRRGGQGAARACWSGGGGAFWERIALARVSQGQGREWPWAGASERPRWGRQSQAGPATSDGPRVALIGPRRGAGPERDRAGRRNSRWRLGPAGPVERRSWAGWLFPFFNLFQEFESLRLSNIQRS